ncbi:hypothetical protein ARSEF4850_003470 [Beauveria asiatica]
MCGCGNGVKQKYFQDDVTDFKDMLAGRVAAITPRTLEECRTMMSDAKQDLRQHSQEIEDKIGALLRVEAGPVEERSTEWQAIMGRKTAPSKVRLVKQGCHGFIPSSNDAIIEFPSKTCTKLAGFDRKHFQRLLLGWIVEENHSFRVCEQGRLRRIFEYLNPLVKITDANINRTTIRRQVLASYEAHKDQVAAVPQTSPGLIHVSFDGWNSGSRHSLDGSRRTGQREPEAPEVSQRASDLHGEENQLTSNDWIVLEHLAKLLGFYEDAVRTLEGDGQLRRRKRGWVGSYGNVWEVVQWFEFLLVLLEKYKQLACGIPNSEHLRMNINLGWKAQQILPPAG